jgi:hypothetical protein
VLLLRLKNPDENPDLPMDFKFLMNKKKFGRPKF